MGQVIFDETDNPLMRMTYKGLCDDAEWQRHLDVMSEWARRGQVYGVVIDAREVGRVPATQRKGIIEWIDRDRSCEELCRRRLDLQQRNPARAVDGDFLGCAKPHPCKDVSRHAFGGGLVARPAPREVDVLRRSRAVHDSMTSANSRLAAAEAQLLAPGAPFELAEEEVFGERVRVFAKRARSLRDVLLRGREFARAEYMVFREPERERRFTFEDHEKLVASAAAAFADRFGVGPGDRVAILAANCPEWIISFWATVSLGAICVGLNASRSS